MTPRLLVAGVGNVFLSDDAFGVEVARRLAARPPRPGVEVADYGIRGVHLAYQLLDGYDALILLDATPLGGAPGTLYVIEPREQPPQAVVHDAHSMEPGSVLALLDALGARVGRVVVVGCEPARLEEGMGLSDPVAAAVPDAVDLVAELIEECLQTAGQEAPRPGPRRK
ncbi:hypothetical protein TH66_06545 [Carbonactinospora thermoautotrophica]|uniref:Hydrogenase maturation protease n=1 Tax=Carbonactinospora thermoautotrophica TaxID=1469144 RepID=A0A132N9H1_9ACTN|nr:hydrogenase maturation protease [Carbonactinospora thermoautotrophica]KWX04813.1 hypothetical protein TH66_06545 [Carbonactinospora thermoautotrophica]KWX06769.1 hypothetical protein TR74_20985 [Carbonactinospora thermoautotrophica]